MSGEDDQRTKERIVEAVRERWNSKRSAYLLSQLGKDFPSELRAISHGRKLIDLINQDFEGLLHLVSKGEGNATVWAVVPATAGDAPGEQSIPTAAPSAVPRFQPPIWAAFRAPLADGRKRFLVQQSGITKFNDLPADERTPPGTLLEVHPEDIADPSASSKDVIDLILRVLRERGVPLSLVTAGRSAPAEGAPSAPSTRPSDRHSLLDALLECLTPAEARRVSLPLDIVYKLGRATTRG